MGAAGSGRIADSRSIRGIIFDLDGVLVDTSHVWFAVQNDVARELGHPLIDEESFRATFGQGTAADVAAFFPGSASRRVDELYHERFLARLGDVAPLGEAKAALADLGRSGILRAVATNTRRDLALALLDRSGLSDGVDLVASASEVAAAKPAPDVVLLAAQRLALPKVSLLFVGDAIYDAEAARGAGIRFVGFRRDGDDRIESLEELTGLLD